MRGLKWVVVYQDRLGDYFGKWAQISGSGNIIAVGSKADGGWNR